MEHSKYSIRRVTAEASAYSASFIDQAILSVEAELDGISGLKAEQKGALKAILSGEDVLALLPTGFGKSLIYQVLPRVCKKLSEMGGCSLFHDVESPIVIVVSPLVALMEDQIKEASKFGVSAAQLGKSDEEILSGKAELVFGSPESWLLNEKWRGMLASSRYRRNIVAIVVDEVHMTYKWGEGPKGNPAFRESFSRLGELRSLVKEGTPILALTASADRPSRDRVISLLNMQGAQRIVVSPNKTNIKLGIVRLPDDKLQCLDWLAKMLREEGLAAPYVLIYCRSISTTGKVFRYLKRQLGEDAWVGRDPERRTKNLLIGNYHSKTLPKYKENVLQSLSGNGNCRVVMATTALGMGMNFPNVSYVIMYGPPGDTEGIVQQVGRAGRNNADADAVLFYHGVQLIKVDKAVRGLVNAEPSECLRKKLYGLFEDTPVSVEPGHRCCLNCHKRCTCAGTGCKEPLPPYQSFQNIVTLPTKFREVDPDDRILLRELLQEYQAYLLQNTVPLFTSPVASTGFSDQLIDAVVDKCSHLFDIDYIATHLPVFKAEHAQEILRIIFEVFDDIPEPEPSKLTQTPVPSVSFNGYFDEDSDDDDALYHALDDTDFSALNMYDSDEEHEN